MAITTEKIKLMRRKNELRSELTDASSLESTYNRRCKELKDISGGNPFLKDAIFYEDGRAAEQREMQEIICKEIANVENDIDNKLTENEIHYLNNYEICMDTYSIGNDGDITEICFCKDPDSPYMFFEIWRNDIAIYRSNDCYYHSEVLNNAIKFFNDKEIPLPNGIFNEVTFTDENIL